MNDYREKVLALVDEGLLNARNVVAMFVSWDTNDSIKEMLEANDILQLLEEIDDEC